MKFINNKKGYTLIHALLACFIIMHTSVLLTLSMKVLSTIIKDQRHTDTLIGVDQIRIILAASETIQMQNNALTFMYKNKECSLEIDDNRVIRRPGYVIYLRDIDHASFIKEENAFYLMYGKQQHKELLYEE